MAFFGKIAGFQLSERAAVAMALAAFLFLSFALNYSIRSGYGLPIHSDEYWHIAMLLDMQESGKIFSSIAGIDKEGTFLEARGHRFWEIHYNIFLFSLKAFTGIKLEQLPLLVPPIVSFIMAFAAFVLARFLFKDNLAALLAGIFSLLLKNDIALLGYWFLVPMALGMAMVPVLLYCFLRSLDSWRYTLMLLIILVNLTFVHVVYSLVVLPAFGLYLLISPRQAKKNLAKIALVAIVLLSLTDRFVKWDLADIPSTVFEIINKVIYSYGPYIYRYPLTDFLGLPIITLAAIGFAYAFARLAWPAAKKRLFPALQENQAQKPSLGYFKLILLFVAFWVLLRLYSDYNKICFLGPCRRSSTGFAIVFLIAAGFGLFAAIKLASKLYGSLVAAGGQQASPFLLKTCFGIAVSLLLLQLLWTMPFQYRQDLYQNIEPDELPAMAWMKKNLDESTLLYVYPMQGDAAHTFTGKRVTFRGPFVSRDPRDTSSPIVFFFALDCEKKKDFIEKNNITAMYVYGRSLVNGIEAVAVNCSGINQTANIGGRIVYETG